MRNGVSHRTKGIYDTQIGRFFLCGRNTIRTHLQTHTAKSNWIFSPCFGMGRAFVQYLFPQKIPYVPA